MSKYNKNQFAVIGLGKFGQSLAKRLAEQGKEVLVIDKDEHEINEISEFVTHSVVADAEDEQVLKAVGISNFDVVCVCMASNMEANILITLMCKELGVPFVVSKASNARHKHVLERIGADMVVFPEENMGRKLANQLLNPFIMDVTDISKEFQIVEISCPVDWAEKSIVEIDLRRNYSLSVIVVIRDDRSITPEPSTVVESTDKLIIGGAPESIEKLIKKVL